jgi:hypothetical protein
LRELLFGNDLAAAVNDDALFHLHTELAQRNPAALQRFQEFRMGRNACAPADELDGGALVNMRVPTDLPQEGCSEEPRHRPADNNGAPPVRGPGWHTLPRTTLTYADTQGVSALATRSPVSSYLLAMGPQVLTAERRDWGA